MSAPFLKNSLQHNIRQALQLEGGFAELVTRGHESEDIQIELQFRLEIAEVERLVTYQLTIGMDNDRPVVRREILRYKRSAYGAPFHFLDFRNGQGYAITNEEDFNKPDEDLEREEQALESPDILAVKGLGQFQRFKAANAFRQLIENWHVSDFHITDARGRKEAGYAEHLSSSGDNLPLVTQFIFERHPKEWETIVRKMRQRVPGIERIEAKSTEDGFLILRFQDGAFEAPFLDRYVSDGTVKMLAYLVLLHDPNPHPLLCVEEPENQLYAQLLGELAEEFRAYSSRAQGGGQVLVTTHSPDFLNAVRLEEVFWLEKQKGISHIHRASDDAQLTALVAEGDHLGELWRQKLFKGANL